ncbi:MAG: hypothetical protein JWN46_913, partial [Acidimicrobiales bacterium]|nr:hypothetical protein [Acidimicrobiales bacterium]
MTFVATHVVGPQGAWGWSAPDAQAQPANALDPRLEVQVLEAQGPWVRVRCSNGWETWTDAGYLSPCAWPPPAPQATVMGVGPPAAGPGLGPQYGAGASAAYGPG